jgi:Flp pilus assembly pilin Flp
MDKLIEWYEKLQQYCGRLQEYRRGQSMAEYALILAGIAVAVYATYNTLGSDITSFINSNIVPDL